ncbi:hypothetical protein KKF86_04715 [bacterium]|nr:hypothetical protein [bacterium]
MHNNLQYTGYVILINRKKDYSTYVINKHVEHLKQLDKTGQLVLCGPFKDYTGGIVIIKAESMNEAKIIAKSDPFIIEGFSTYELRTLELANKENHYSINE